jgi:hypothetical protein
MQYTITTQKRESDSEGSLRSYSSLRQSNVVKRLFALALMTICLVFAGAQTVPTSKASAPCDLVCGEPYFENGQCLQECCPADFQCKVPCEIRPCQK